MTDMKTDSPNVKIDLTKLKNVQIPSRILRRGEALKEQGRVRRNRLYPWKFQVTGDNHSNGTSLYFVNLADHQCSCMWFQNTGTTCKHLVAALLVYVENQERGIVVDSTPGG